MIELSLITVFETMQSMNKAGVINRTVMATLLVFTIACSKQEPETIGDTARPVAGSIAGRIEAAGESLQGEVLDPETGLVVFRGVPFAAAPVGGNRWRPPSPHTPRQGVQDATAFGPACPQQQGNPEFYRFVAERFGAAPERVPLMENISEDCLYLNVWVKNPGAGAKRPVMVWIYGGGNKNGYAQEPEYLGGNFARRDVVYVSINYRVGALGFLAHQGLSAESERGVSGNYGILDQVAALHWVQDNIAAFGGDPENVTVFGESAGAGDIATLIVSPLARGLFKRAISQSGGYPVDIFYTLEQAQKNGARVAEHLGMEDPQDPAGTVKAMRALDWRTVVDGAAESGEGDYSEVAIDGWVLTDALAASYLEGAVHDVDLMIGANRNENYPWVKEDPTADDLSESLASFGKPYSAELAALLADQEDIGVRLQIDRLESGRDFLCPSLFIADAMARHDHRVYFYYFTRVRPGGNRLLAYHGAEISYAHGTAYEWMPADQTDHDLTEMMGQYWVNFAVNGSPNGKGLPEWPAFTASGGEYQELGDAVAPGAGLEPKLCGILSRKRLARLKESEAMAGPGS